MDLTLRPVGVVRSPISSSAEMPRQGVAARVEVFPKFADGLLRIEANTHVMVVGWLHYADRDRLQVQRPWHRLDVQWRGVFACRSPDRPNPLGITTARLLRVEGTTLYLDRLDMIDGTPVLDLKPHAPGLDSAFAARSARELACPGRLQAKQTLESMLIEAERFHGERCAGVALGAKVLHYWMSSLDVAQKDADTIVWLGGDGCLADALQALTGATFGNGRLRVHSQLGEEFCLQRRSHRLRFSPRPRPTEATEEQILAQDVAQLFRLRMDRGDEDDDRHLS